MLDLKSINLYFFSIKKIVLLGLKKIYYKSSIYNKTLVSPIPSRIYYHPSSHLITSLNLINNNKYIIENFPGQNVWSLQKNKGYYNNLHSFLWLNNLDRKNKKIGIQNIISDWIKNFNNFNSDSWDFSNLSKRIIAWCSNTDIIFYESDKIYKEKFFLSLIKQINFLTKNLNNIPTNSNKIGSIAAIILAGLIFKENHIRINIGLKHLEKFINIYFDKFGFTKSRNPEDVFLCIKYFVIIKEWLKEAQEPVPEFIDIIISKCGNAYSFVTNSQKNFATF